MAANPTDEAFADPPWEAALDAEAWIDAVPAEATMSGLFLSAVARAVPRGTKLASARSTYTAFRRYPLREHCVLLVEAARALFPDKSLREGLRRLGRGAPRTLLGSMLGRVVLGSVEGPGELVRAMAKSYPLHMSPGSLVVTEDVPGRIVLALRDIHHFLDSHNVGVFEGVLRHAGVEDGSVRIRSLSPTDADLLCTWTTETRNVRA